MKKNFFLCNLYSSNELWTQTTQIAKIFLGKSHDFWKISEDFWKTIKKASIAKGLPHCLLPDRQHILSMSLRMYGIPLSRVCWRVYPTCNRPSQSSPRPTANPVRILRIGLSNQSATPIQHWKTPHRDCVCRSPWTSQHTASPSIHSCFQCLCHSKRNSHGRSWLLKSRSETSVLSFPYFLYLTYWYSIRYIQKCYLFPNRLSIGVGGR